MSQKKLAVVLPYARCDDAGPSRAARLNQPYSSSQAQTAQVRASAGRSAPQTFRRPGS